MPAREVFICDAVRTPIGRYGGALAKVRADDLAAIPIRELVTRHPGIRDAVDEVYLGCANQAGEDNRNVARMAALLAGMPGGQPAMTLNRLCASGLDAVGAAARAIKAGDAELAIAGGVESMTRAPFVMGKSEAAFQRTTEVYDTTIGWRFINPLLKAQYGVDSMPETAENVAEEFQVTRDDQDAYALRSQQRAARAQADGTLAAQMVAVEVPGGRAGPTRVERDEHPRADVTLESLQKLKASAAGRDRHGRQRLRRQRRRGGDDRRLRRSGREARADPPRARTRHGFGRRRAPHHGHRPGARRG
jgi:3-oxoadipyl-CoA thiolase